MSISYDAKLVCGFRVDVEEVVMTKAQYNVDTGEPYEVEVPSHEIAVIDGVQIASTEDDLDAFYGTVDGLEFGESGYEHGQKWLGQVMGEVNDYKDFRQVATDIPKVVAVFAEKHDLKPRWILVMSCG